MSLPLFRTADLRDFERQAAAGLPSGTLMQRAGSAAATWIARRFPQAAHLVVVCGPGNNGGDGYVCATALRSTGRKIVCVALAAPSTEDARTAAAAWCDAGGATLDRSPAEQHCDLAIDAMFGIGLARPLGGAARDAARWMSAQSAPCIALDVPSGLNADTGAWVDGVAGVHATATVSFLGAKPGLFTADGIDACGEVVIDTLGLALPGSVAVLNEPDEFAAVALPRARNTHKGRFGNLLVIGGAAGMVGAPLIAARAALRLGAGRVYVDAIGSTMDVDPQTPELMFRRADTLSDLQAVVIGCGLGDGDLARHRLDDALRLPTSCVLDADALNLLASDARLRALATGASGPRILTPHPLEAARLLATTAEAVQKDRVQAAILLARQFDAWIVLKGAGSVIAGAGRYWINPTGGPALATAGTGDALAGMIGALLAQGFDAQSSVLGAVWLHGRAADDFGADAGLVASDIAPLAARALAALRSA